MKKWVISRICKEIHLTNTNIYAIISPDYMTSAFHRIDSSKKQLTNLQNCVIITSNCELRYIHRIDSSKKKSRLLWRLFSYQSHFVLYFDLELEILIVINSKSNILVLLYYYKWKMENLLVFWLNISHFYKFLHFKVHRITTDYGFDRCFRMF